MERFSSLKYKVHLATEPLDKAFPDLFRLPEFKKIKLRKEWERIVKYIVFLYDKNSDLNEEFESDLAARKDAAAIEAGYEREASGKWDKELVAIMEMRDKEVHAVIMAFLTRVQRKAEWTDFVVTEQELEEFQNLRFAPIDTTADDKDVFDAAKKKDALMKACNDRLTYLDNLKKVIFGDNKDVMDAEFSEMMTPESSERILKTMPIPYEEINEEVNVPANTGG